MFDNIFRIGLIVMLVAVIPGCHREEPKKISLEKRETAAPRQAKTDERHLRVAIGGMITPREGYTYYRRLLDYVGEKMGSPVDIVDRESYAEVNRLLERGEVDAAFVCGGPYVHGHRDFGLELLVAPQAYGQTVYYSYIIVAKGSPISAFEGLRGKSFAFTDPMSNTGRMFPAALLARMGETPETFFIRYVYTQSHDRAIKAVAQGVVDGAAVDSLIWEYANRTDPVFTSKTRVIRKSPPYGIPPVVVNPRLDHGTRERLRQILLDAHNDERGRNILEGMMIDKFVLISDSAYDSIREMETWDAGRKKEGTERR